MEPSMPERPPEPLKAQIFDILVNFSKEEAIISHSFSSRLTRTQKEVAPQLAEAFGLYYCHRGKGKDAFISVHKDLPPISASRFVPSEKKWKNDVVETNEGRIESFSVLTLNLLADKIYSEQRSAAFFRLLVHEIGLKIYRHFLNPEQQNADFVLLQEVSTDMHQSITQNPWIQSSYWITDSDGDSIRSSGLMILSRFPPRECRVCHFRSSPKAMMLAKFLVNGQDLSIVNLHLKAGLTSRQAQRREEQLQQAVSIQRKLGFDDALLIGDFNLPGGHDEFPHPNDKVAETPLVLDAAEYEELWPKFYPNDLGLTYDYVNNSLAELVCQLILKGKGRRIRGNRFDRIYNHKSNKYWDCESICRVGMEPIGFDEVRQVSIFVSDHYAVRADFSSKLTSK